MTLEYRPGNWSLATGNFLGDILFCMAEYATKNDVQMIVDKAVNKAVDDLSQVIQAFATNVDKRFDAVDARFEAVDRRFDRIEDRLLHLEKGQRELLERVERIEDTLLNMTSDIRDVLDRIFKLEKRFPSLTEAEVRDLEKNLAKLVAWAKDISVKTGVKLKI